ncbi:PREDICTED: RNA pseudouridylate synthase domain-containing protein 4 isoform X1 [Chinchilla lanigera]|uniref:Pseudouridylate synthase RPUSD4, mitochondrial n=1 Tax=Chinchilla lanigera TaxID=34839 RepID=A0A8C2W2A8_CHILA|nr:PREDICTED: RNA pseudouridylate synthase domain-containing protein 4 isoform X1 [Chinchilla lanigera]
MAAPRRGAPVLLIRGSGPLLKSFFTLVSKPLCSSAAASRPLDAQRLAEKLRAQKREQKTKTKPVPTSPVQRRVQELVRFTQQLQRVHPNVLAKALSRGILHQDKDLVVINKPYGLPVHGGPGVQLCISEVLPILAKILHGHKAEPLHLCHRLDKETTGVMVLAWEKEVAHQVQELFRTRQVAKKYWAVTVHVPVPSAGVVDIPIIEKEVQGQQQHHKMTLSPSYRMDNGKMVKVRTSRNAQVAVTQYRVLSSTVSSALVELQPITGIKHQLRVHLSFGLDCPILGDHKYSDWNRLAPQKLPVGTLKKLGLEQPKARYIPLHLHARQLILPPLGFRKEELHLVCRLPRFFVHSLRRLGLEMPDQDENGHNEARPLEAQ